MTLPDPTPVQLGPGDLRRLRALNALFADVFDDQDAYAAAPPDDAYLERLLARDDIVVLVTLEGEAVVGGLVAYVFDKLERARREIYIYDLAVDAGHRRRGIATAMIGALRRIARARGAWMIFVQADPSDAPAIALYESLGAREDVLHFDIPPAP